MADLNRLLNTVGKKSFVDFYQDYQNLYMLKDKLAMDKKLSLAKKLLERNPDAEEESGQVTRINAAIRIFKYGWDKEALEIIINSKHFKISNEVKQRASELLKKELVEQ
jgi:hypothetical protein